MSEQDRPSIFAPLSHGVPSGAVPITTPQTDPFHKTNPGPLVNTPPKK